jgi:tRNA pseudouridine55 synthase
MAVPNKPTISGILVVDKPVGPTSMQVVANVRHRAHGAKTGHAGTLDPLASGVLVLGLGTATRQLTALAATDKEYITVIDLSARTAGHDEESPRQEVRVERQPSEKDVISALDQFRGTIMQAPPAFSAVKLDGKRAYAQARQGKQVAPQPREVLVHDIDLIACDWPLVTLSIACGKGFYIRSLARDLGNALGTGGYCRLIRRTAVGPFDLAVSTLLDELPEELQQHHLLDASTG